jgi:hypothetical protein
MKPIHPLLSTVLCLTAVATACAAQSDADLVVSSDAELGAMAARLLPDLAERSGMELREPVRLEERSREELARYLRAKLDEDLPEDEARARARAYALLGLVEPGLDLRGLLLELYGEQVAGFYEPDSTALYVLDDQPEAGLEALLVHELVHAVQDQSTDLQALTDPSAGNDRSTAAMAVIEGHATLVMFEHLTEQMTGAPVDLGSIPDFAGQVGPVLASMTAQFPALAGAPRVVRESLIFPYVDGAGFVQRLWAGGNGRPDPFGDGFPLSTEQVLSPGAAAPLPLSFELTGARTRLEDTLGALELRILVEDVLGWTPEAADELVRGWDGDRWVLVEKEGGAAALSYATVWESERARSRFVDAVRAAPTGFGGPVEIEAFDVGGRAGALLRIGGADYRVTTRVAPGP